MGAFGMCSEITLQAAPSIWILLGGIPSWWCSLHCCPWASCMRRGCAGSCARLHLTSVHQPPFCWQTLKYQPRGPPLDPWNGFCHWRNNRCLIIRPWVHLYLQYRKPILCTILSRESSQCLHHCSQHWSLLSPQDKNSLMAQLSPMRMGGGKVGYTLKGKGYLATSYGLLSSEGRCVYFLALVLVFSFFCIQVFFCTHWVICFIILLQSAWNEIRIYLFTTENKGRGLILVLMCRWTDLNFMNQCCCAKIECCSAKNVKVSLLEHRH